MCLDIVIMNIFAHLRAVKATFNARMDFNIFKLKNCRNDS